MNTAKKPDLAQLVNNVIPVWQPLGYSTYRITMDIAKKLGVKTAHTGVLDPLAEGVIIVLSGEQRLKKIELAGWKKLYEFDVAFGISTDSYDGMGIITKEEITTGLDEKSLEKVGQKFIGKYIQQVPLYSAKKLNGKKLFEYPKLGLHVEKLPEKAGEIFKLEFISLKKVKAHDLAREIIAKIEKVKHGEFRQEVTIRGWKNYLAYKPNKDLQVATFKAELSRGLYVRSLAQDIARLAGTHGFVSKLVRLRNGEFSSENCFTLEELC